jgi:uncharacterized protein YidB (DUF937 family)
MGLLDNLGGMISNLVGGATQQQDGDSASLVSGGLAKTGLGDMGGLVQQLQQSGLGAQVQAWMNGNSNFPVSPQQLQSALGDEHVRALAQHYGLPLDAALNLLAQHIPNAVAQTNGGQTSADGSTPSS